MTFNKNGFGYGVAYYTGAMVIGTVSVVGRLLVGLLMLVGKKTIIEGGPRTMEASQWLKEKSAIFFVKCYTFIKPHAREVGKILIALLIIVARKLEMKIKPKIVASGHFIGRKCTELVQKYRAKLMQKINVGSRRIPSTPEIGEVVNPNNLSVDQSVLHDIDLQR
ncbi:MAG TPA: hypothetical protein VFR94_08955 [Nitrososphaeraceae archaeon]|nr:hypothetical protein [Nitrososphaeraceae archaeon]